MPNVMPWQPAPQNNIPTANERLQMVARLCDRERTLEIVIYSHGTGVVRLQGATWTCDDVMKSYDVPFEGEGSPNGDIHPLAFDDDSCVFSWLPVTFHNPDPVVQGGAMFVAAPSEIATHWPAVSPTEVFQGLDPADMKLLKVGLWARRQRTLDAQQLKRIAYWPAL